MVRRCLAAFTTLVSLSAVAGQVVIPSSSTVSVLPVATEGAACTATADNNTAITADYSAVLTCQSGTWRRPTGRYWKTPVANHAGLPLTGNEAGDVRLTLDTGRLFVWTGAAWQATAIDQNGNLTVPGVATINRLAGKLQMDASTIFIEGTACPAGTADNGRLARDASGLLLSCQGGVWKKAAGSGGLKQYRWGCFWIAGWAYVPEYVGLFETKPSQCVGSPTGTWAYVGTTSDRNGLVGCWCYDFNAP